MATLRAPEIIFAERRLPETIPCESSPSAGNRGIGIKMDLLLSCLDPDPIDKDFPGSGIDQPPDLLSFDHGFTT